MGSTRDRRSLQHRPPAINVETVGARDLLSSSPVACFLPAVPVASRQNVLEQRVEIEYIWGGWVAERQVGGFDTDQPTGRQQIQDETRLSTSRQ